MIILQCSKCEAKIELSEEEDSIVCPKCGAEIEMDACGGKKKIRDKDIEKKEKKKFDSATRQDIRDLTWDLMTEKMTETPEGFLKGRAVVTNIGVFPYILDGGRIRHELRLDTEVFDSESLDSLSMKPITNDHPKTGVNSDSYKSLVVGSIGSDIYNDSYRVYAPVLIADTQAVQDVKNGKIAFSCGYSCDLEMTSGVWMGVSYDAIQRNIRYNHLALVNKGRAGDDAVLRMDSACGVCVSIKNVQENNKMAKLNLDGAEFEVPEVVASAHIAMKQKIDKADSDLALALSETSKVSAERDMAVEKVQKADAEIVALKDRLDKAPAEIEARIASRVILVKTAQDCGVEVKSDMSDLDIKKAVILVASPKLDLSEKDDSYVQARFDGAVEVLVDSKKQDVKNAEKVAEGIQIPEVKVDSVASHQKMIADLESAYK